MGKQFLLTPLREGRLRLAGAGAADNDFYSRPCGRGDFKSSAASAMSAIFLLTPLREGRLDHVRQLVRSEAISTHAPAGGATEDRAAPSVKELFLLTPLREGRRGLDLAAEWAGFTFLLTPLREGRREIALLKANTYNISTHAPAGGATAIFHKSVMRFCGKLPKDDTVLCLASFGFPRRDPKAVYLAWISCANLPQKCVREGLALKDQGTSCFHEGLASHAFDPVLV